MVVGILGTWEKVNWDMVFTDVIILLNFLFLLLILLRGAIMSSRMIMIVSLKF